MRKLFVFAASLGLGAGGWGFSSGCDAEVPAPSRASEISAQSAPALGRPLDLGELGKISGGEAVTLTNTNQVLTAVNSAGAINATTVRSGAVTFSSNAFQGFSGIGNFVINTGNNNILQSSLSVTVVPAP